MKANILVIILLCIMFSCESKQKKSDELPVLSADTAPTLKEYNRSLQLLTTDAKIAITDTIEASSFGVKADYNGKIGTDNRKALQLAIDFCSANQKVLRLPKGKILVSSYGITPSARAHANILELKSNTKIVGNNSELVVSKAFHDQSFVLLSGLNAVHTKDFVNLSNIEIKNITFNFNNKEVFMATKYQLMRGIEMGQCINGEVANCTFLNGDLTSAIITGQGNRNVSKNIKIHHNKFIDLIKSPKNEDHTSVYLNSTESSIFENTFTNRSVQGKLVACAGELHNSNTSFYNNTISGYLRMNFVAAAATENHHISQLSIYNNRASITSAAVYLWTDDNTSISNLSIKNNTITSTHVDGYSMAFNGSQGILADATVGKNTLVENIVVENNKSVIAKTIISGRAVNFLIDKNRKFKNFKEQNNTCTGCKDGKYYESGFKLPF